MLTNTLTTYTCEICGTSYESKEAAELCEKAGIPKNHNKFIGKYLLVPTQVLISSNTDKESSIDWKIKWNIIRIDENFIKPLAPTSIKNTLMNLQMIGHRITYKCLHFYPNSYVFDSLLSKAVEIPEVLRAALLDKYLDAHSKHKDMPKDAFHKYLHDRFDTVIQDVILELNLNIKNSDFDNYSLEGLNNVSNQIINR